MRYIKRGYREEIKEGEHKGKCLELVTAAFDEPKDLITVTQSTKFAPYSLAWVLSTGDIYALSSSDEWILQPNARIVIYYPAKGDW